LRQSSGDLAFLSTRFIAFGNQEVSPAVVDFLERVIRATPIDVVADFYLALVDHDKRRALAVLGQVPTVVIAAEQDRLIPARQVAELAAAIPRASLVRVQGAGHIVILERPEVVTEEIADLVALALDQAASGRRPA
jgi:pimeloyl-ACP methyl ester carboxylesterase